MGKPVERQNHSFSFFILAALIAISTAWSFYDEFVGRRPWKDYQERIFGYEREKATQDLRFFERKLESGEIKVAPDPAKPAETMTVADARKRVEEIELKLAPERETLAKLDRELKEGKIQADDADLVVKNLKSEDDGLFYIFQHAEHEEALRRSSASKQMAAGDKAGAEAALKEADEAKKHLEEARVDREKKAEEIRKAVAEADEAARKYAEIQARKKVKWGEHDRLKVAIEAALDPIITAKSSLEAVAKKRTELTQYWLTSYDNSVDRCQNCHAEVDKCGFTRPHEVLAALAAPNAKPDEVFNNFCVNPDTTEGYKRTAADICKVEFDEVASAAGKIDGGRCFDGEERTRVAEFLINYCGPEAAAVKVLQEHALKAACVAEEGYGKLALYIEDVEKKGACSLELKPAGDTCVEGARRDELITWLSQHCPETSSTLAGLKQGLKACASGEAGKKLAAVKPVLYDVPVWVQTHPHRQDLLGSHHPVERFGCTSCHEGQGAQTKGVAGNPFQHGYDDHYWEKPMLDLVAHKKYRPKTFGPPDASEGVPGEWAMHEKHYVESTCAKCHTEEVHLPYADTYSRGRRLMAEIGCHACHPVDTFRDFPKLGPTLTDLKKKTTPAFLATWIAYPRGFRPRTRMPNFWPEALDVGHRVREGTKEAATREDEVRKIAAYLWKNSEPSNLPAPPVDGDAERGKLLAQQVGCRACHAFSPPDKLCKPDQIAAGKSHGTPEQPGECEVARSMTASEARDFAPNLSNIGRKTNERWLFAWLKNPSAMWAGTRMPNLRLSDAEAADLAAYLMTLKAGPDLKDQPLFDNESSPEFAQAAVEGNKLITKYGCAGCHLVKGHEDDPKIGADLNEYGRKSVELFDFGNAVPNPRHHSWFNFVDLKLRAPRAYRYERVETRMPQFDFNDDEVQALMTFLKSRSAEKVPPAFMADRNEKRVAIARGDQAMEYFNCKGCHVIDGEGGRIRDIYVDDDLAKAPPILQQEGWRVQPDWLFGFLRDPSNRLRPWLSVRMPTFPLGDEKATTLVRSFAANAGVTYPYLSVERHDFKPSEADEAKAMVDELRCFSCHTAGEPKPDQDKSSLAPNLQLAKRRLRPDWIVVWIKNPQSLQDGTKMPSFFTPDDMGAVMYSKYFEGSQEKQIKALRDFVMALPDTPAPPPSKPSKPQARR